MPAGRVASLQRWPVKGMGGEAVDELALDAFGAAGDRSYAIFDVHKGARRRVNAEQVPRLLAWSAAYPANGGARASREQTPHPLLTGPDGVTRPGDDPDLPAALGADLGREVTLAREPRGQQDRPTTVHITVEASLRALGATLGGDVDVRRFRSNIHLDLDAAPFAEEAWTGRGLRIGAVDLEIVERCERCPVPGLDPSTQSKWPALLRLLADEHELDFGLIARLALQPAVVRVGDHAELR